MKFFLWLSPTSKTFLQRNLCGDMLAVERVKGTPPKIGYNFLCTIVFSEFKMERSGRIVNYRNISTSDLETYKCRRFTNLITSNKWNTQRTWNETNRGQASISKRRRIAITLLCTNSKWQQLSAIWSQSPQTIKIEKLKDLQRGKRKTGPNLTTSCPPHLLGHSLWGFLPRYKYIFPQFFLY